MEADTPAPTPEPELNVFRVLPVTAHLIVAAEDIPPDWRLLEIAGKIRYVVSLSV